MKEKVVSFKTSIEFYNKLKQTNKSFREILEPMLIAFFNEEPRYTHNIPKETLTEYEDICKWLDGIKEAGK